MAEQSVYVSLCVSLLLACSNEGLLLESRVRPLAVDPTKLELAIPRPADSFANSVGVTFVVANGEEAQVARSALLDLGVRHIRSFAQDIRPFGFGLTAAVAGGELNLHLVMDPRLEIRGSQLPQLLMEHATLESIEGPNDYDAYGIDLSAADIAAAMQDLRLAVDVSSRKVLLVDGLDSAKNGVGDLSGLLDYGNFERFRNRQLPGRSLDEGKMQARSVCGGRPLFVTECGYSNLAGHERSISEEAAARYVPRLLLSHFAQGIERTFLDDLRDGPKPTEPPLAQGLVRYDGERKAAFTSVQRLLQHTLDAGAPFQTSPLEIGITASADTARHILLQRRDGTHVLALWNEVESVDADSGQTVTPPPLSVTIELAAVRSYALFRPSLAAGSIESGAGRLIDLSVPDDVVLLELTAY